MEPLIAIIIASAMCFVSGTMFGLLLGSIGLLSVAKKHLEHEKTILTELEKSWKA